MSQNLQQLVSIIFSSRAYLKKKYNIKVLSRFKICNVSRVDLEQIEKYFQSRKELASLKNTISIKKGGKL